MISTILISALLSLLNTDGLDKNNSLLTAVWPESLWALHVFWGWSTTGWCDAYEVRFQIPPGPASFASRNSPHIVCIWNSIWQTPGCHRSLRVQNKPLNRHHCTRKGPRGSLGLKQEKTMRKEVPKKNAVLYLLSLRPVSFRISPERLRREEGIRKGNVKSWPGNLWTMSSC